MHDAVIAFLQCGQTFTSLAKMQRRCAAHLTLSNMHFQLVLRHHVVKAAAAAMHDAVFLMSCQQLTSATVQRRTMLEHLPEAISACSALLTQVSANNTGHVPIAAHDTQWRQYIDGQTSDLSSAPGSADAAT